MQCCILSKFYIKPQHPSKVFDRYLVVSYRNSTSNHNSGNGYPVVAKLYLIEILHQTTTKSGTVYNYAMLYLIEILHQTTTTSIDSFLTPGCILSKFYIKPQLEVLPGRPDVVVSYRNSTSNHN